MAKNPNLVERLASRFRRDPTGATGRIENAIASGCLTAVYQPIVDLRTGDTFAFESLARSSSPELPNPYVLFNTAVEERATGRLGRELRALAVDGAPDRPLFLNIHPHEFDEGFLVRTDDAMFYHEHEVFLEVTESVPLSHFEQCHGVLHEIRSKGMRLAIDDLGAGYSNLVYIAELVPDIVKLDMGLIRELQESHRKQRVITALVRMCEDLDASVVAEGIETPDELRAVIDCGVHYGQGYLLARPAKPAPDVFWPIGNDPAAAVGE
ncbi:MAG: EAL domain-containing protein [Myxococcota bacterium]